ncbi:TPA: hypothetical protein ACRZZI_004989 [Vibrio harveyi]
MKKLLLTSAITLAASFGAHAESVTPAQITQVSNQLNAAFTGQQVDDVTTADSAHAYLFGNTLAFAIRYKVSLPSSQFDAWKVINGATDEALDRCRSGWGKMKYVADNINKVQVSIWYEFSDGLKLGNDKVVCPQ